VTVIVDREVEFHGHRFVGATVTPLKAVQAAYNDAITTATNAGRTPVQVEVVIRVSPSGGTDTPA
jgi:hypothetical protein